jgi:hypothetical protein
MPIEFGSQAADGRLWRAVLGQIAVASSANSVRCARQRTNTLATASCQHRDSGHRTFGTSEPIIAQRTGFPHVGNALNKFLKMEKLGSPIEAAELGRPVNGLEPVGEKQHRRRLPARRDGAARQAGALV